MALVYIKYTICIENDLTQQLPYYNLIEILVCGQFAMMLIRSARLCDAQTTGAAIGVDSRVSFSVAGNVVYAMEVDASNFPKLFFDLCDFNETDLLSK